MRYLVLAFFGCLLACASSAVTPEARTNAPLPPWQVRMTMSGGFAGVAQTVMVTSDGALTARDVKRGLGVTRRLDDRRLAEIAQTLSALRAEPERGEPFPGRCADCFVYQIEAVLDGEQRQIRISSDRLADSPYRDLVRILTETMRHALGR